MYFHPLILSPAQKQQRLAAYEDFARPSLPSDRQYQLHPDAIHEFYASQQENLKALSEAAFDLTHLLVRWSARAVSVPLELLRVSIRSGTAALAVACSLYVAPSLATEVESYLHSAAQRDVAMFDALDRDRDGRLTIEEVRGNVDFEARFNDFDINRDGVITREELTRYVELRYGIVLTKK